MWYQKVISGVVNGLTSTNGEMSSLVKMELPPKPVFASVNA